MVLSRIAHDTVARRRRHHAIESGDEALNLPEHGDAARSCVHRNNLGNDKTAGHAQQRQQATEQSDRQ